jgi:LSD1 subclass zinc finger protein
MAVLHKEYRCAGCKKLLFKGWVAEGEVQVKCKSCHTLTEVVESKFDALLCAIEHCPRRIVPKAMEKK